MCDQPNRQVSDMSCSGWWKHRTTACIVTRSYSRKLIKTSRWICMMLNERSAPMLPNTTWAAEQPRRPSGAREDGLTGRKWWAAGSVPAAVISGALSVEKPDSRMAALSMLEVRDRGREGAALTTALLLSGQLDINTRCCLPLCVCVCVVSLCVCMCVLMAHQAEVVLRGNQTRPVSEGETLSQSPILPSTLRELICFKSGEASGNTNHVCNWQFAFFFCFLRAAYVSLGYFLFSAVTHTSS